MGSFVRSTAARFSRATTPAQDGRVDRIVGRQRELKAVEVQGKLSPQARDPFSEQMSDPLYDASAYGGTGEGP